MSWPEAVFYSIMVLGLTSIFLAGIKARKDD